MLGRWFKVIGARALVSLVSLVRDGDKVAKVCQAFSSLRAQVCAVFSRRDKSHERLTMADLSLAAVSRHDDACFHRSSKPSLALIALLLLGVLAFVTSWAGGLCGARASNGKGSNVGVQAVVRLQLQ